MTTGTIAKVIADRGFFFIKPDDGSPDLFAHCNQLQGVAFSELTAGARVCFEVELDRTRNKPRAVGVAVVS